MCRGSWSLACFFQNSSDVHIINTLFNTFKPVCVTCTYSTGFLPIVFTTKILLHQSCWIVNIIKLIVTCISAEGVSWSLFHNWNKLHYSMCVFTCVQLWSHVMSASQLDYSYLPGVWNYSVIFSKHFRCWPVRMSVQFHYVIVPIKVWPYFCKYRNKFYCMF